MHAFTGQCIQISWQRCHQRFALTGAHLSDLAKMKHHPADQLHVEMAHLQHPATCLAADCKRFRQNIVELFTSRDTLLECGRLGLQFCIGQFFNRRFERVNFTHCFLILLEQALVAAAKNLGQ